MPITAKARRSRPGRICGNRARQTIDRLLTDAGWLIQSRDETNINAARGVVLPSPNCSGRGPSRALLSFLPLSPM
jgi:hypothetical protein